MLRGSPVAFYDVDTVLRSSRSFATQRARLDALAARTEAESAPLQADVDALRGQIAHGAVLPIAARRDLEAQLAQRTIALLVARTEGMREIAAEREHLRESIEGRIVPAVARLAHERNLPVVVRAGSGTIVLDDDAVDLSPSLVAALDADAGGDANPAFPPEGRRLRFQSCDASPPTEVANAQH